MRKGYFWIGALLAAIVSGAALGQPAWQPIDPAEARLIVAPRAFGQAAQRLAMTYSGVYYERVATRFDTSRRFFNIVLREAPANTLLTDPLDLQATAHELTGNNQPGAFLFGETRTLPVGLGTASYLPFTFAGSGCAAFHIPYGSAVGQSAPLNIVKGIYCDPLVSRLPEHDIALTLNAIGVRGIYQP